MSANQSGEVDANMTPDAAVAVWEVLAEECGAVRDHGFLSQQPREHITEWRFSGSLGFGGKFWRNPHSRRPDGSWGEFWYVNCYLEDETPERRASIDRANARLWDIQQRATTREVTA